MDNVLPAAVGAWAHDYHICLHMVRAGGGRQPSHCSKDFKMAGCGWFGDGLEMVHDINS